MKKRYKIGFSLMVSAVVVLAIILVYPMLTTKTIEKNSAELVFKDQETSCPLNGDIYINNTIIGKSNEGSLKLSEDEQNINFRDSLTLSIAGKTNECFNKNQNLPFYREWIVPNMQYYIDNNAEVIFETELTPRNPRYYEEMQAYIQPEAVESYLPNITKYFKTDNVEDHLDILTSQVIRYQRDWTSFKQSEYWQTPVESLERGHGDCEDWATTTLSLIRAYDDSIACYNIKWESHMSIFCYYDNAYYIYDQDKTKFKTILNEEYSISEKKVQLREMRNQYFDDFGIKPSQQYVYAVFNEAELVEFNQPEDFIDWMLSLRE